MHIVDSRKGAAIVAGQLALSDEGEFRYEVYEFDDDGMAKWAVVPASEVGGAVDRLTDPQYDYTVEV